MKGIFQAVRKKLHGESGQTFILVMTVTALATVLGIMAMSGALMSVRLYGMKRVSDKNFYKLEMAMEEVETGLARDVAQVYFASGAVPSYVPESTDMGMSDEAGMENSEESIDDDADGTDSLDDAEDIEDADDAEGIEDAEGSEDSDNAGDGENGGNTENTENATGPDAAPYYAYQASSEGAQSAEYFLRYQVGIFDPTIYEVTNRIQMDTRKEAGLKLMESYLASLSPSVTAEGARAITVDRTEELSVQVENIRIDTDGTMILQDVHLILTNYERDARSEITCSIVIPSRSAIHSIDEVVLVENWERIG